MSGSVESRFDRVPDVTELKFRINRYTKVRGEPKFLRIFCASCNELVIIYQKDGPGSLLRCYTDRIHYPRLVYPGTSLKCRKCSETIGLPMIYKPEQRPAYRMLRDKFFMEKT